MTKRSKHRENSQGSGAPHGTAMSSSFVKYEGDNRGEEGGGC